MKAREDYSELEVHVDAFRHGEETGFRFFFKEFYPSLCFFANSLLKDQASAEDIVSSAFIKIWQKHDKFFEAKAIRAYLYQIVRHDCFKWHRQQAKATVLQKEVAYLSSTDSEKDHFANLVESELSRQLQQTIDVLPAECRKIFKLLYAEGKTVAQVASELQLSPSTVKTQKTRGLVILRKKMAHYLSLLFY